MSAYVSVKSLPWLQSLAVKTCAITSSTPLLHGPLHETILHAAVKKKTCEQVSLTEKHVCFRIRFGSRVCKVTQNLGCHSPLCLFLFFFFLTQMQTGKTSSCYQVVPIVEVVRLYSSQCRVACVTTSAIPYLSLILTLEVLLKVKLLHS